MTVTLSGTRLQIGRTLRLPLLPPDAPMWATDLLRSLNDQHQEYAQIMEILGAHRTLVGTRAEQPDADSTGILYVVTDEGVVEADLGTWTNIPADYSLSAHLHDYSPLTHTHTAFPVIFQASETAGAAIDLTAAATPAAEADVVFDQEDFAGTGFTYDNATGILTIGSELDGKNAMFNVHINADTCTDRTQLVLELLEDTGSGYAMIARSAQYSARDTDQNEGAAHLNGFLHTLADGYRYKVMASANVDAGTPVFGSSTFWSVVTLS